MPKNTLLITRNQFEIVKTGRNTVEVTASHPKHGRTSVTVRIPHTETSSADDYAIQRWIRLVG
jgi:hypothetical protein